MVAQSRGPSELPVLRTNTVVTGLFFAALLATGALAQSRPAAPVPATEHPNLSAIVERMEQAALANRENYRPYVLTRKYLMYGADIQEKPSSEVLAEITFVPPTTKEYKIVETRGSSRGEGVVKHILDNESKATQSGNAPGAVSRDNYDFLYLGEGSIRGHRCYILGLQPKRKDKDLVVGRAWVDQNTFLVRRVDGQMSKLPSWWLKSVNVTLEFGGAHGMWLQTGLKAVAEVRIFGTHVLTAQAVKFQSDETVARNTPVRGPKRHPRPQDVIGVAAPVQP